MPGLCWGWQMLSSGGSWDRSSSVLAASRDCKAEKYLTSTTKYLLFIVRTCELLCCWGWVWRELRVWRLRPTSLRGAAEEEADTRHWLSTEAVWCTLSSVLELSRWLSI